MAVEWTEKRLHGGHRLLVSNGEVPLTENIQCLTSAVNNEEGERILSAIEDSRFIWEGFDQRRRIQRFVLDSKRVTDSDRIECHLQNLRHRLQEATNLHFSDASIEECAPEKFSDNPCQVATSFEGPCRRKDCSTCCVALVPLDGDALVHWNRPHKRQAMCWTLESLQHQTNVLLKQGSAYVRSGENLHLWRSRLAGYGDRPTVVIKLYTLCQDCGDDSDYDDDAFGYVASQQSQCCPGPMPCLEDLLTIVVTTSPIRSNPSTELLERVFETFRFAGEGFLRCRKIIVCDGFRTQNGSNDSVSKKHQNTKQAMRSGIVTSIQAEKYQQFKSNLKNLSSHADLDSPFYNTSIEELDERFGYGYALRYALRYCVKTDYICVIQHDRTFMRPTPIKEILEVMRKYPNVKYVGCSMRSNLAYRDIFYSKYGKTYAVEYENMIIRPRELLVDGSLYGPDSNSCQQGLAANPQLRDNLLALAESYKATAQCLEYQAWLRESAVPSGEHQMTLSPTLFWYDNIHVAETRHYRDFIYNSQYKMVARGGFVEEGVLPVLKKALDRLGLKNGHERFGCFLVDDHSGFFFTGHLDGGSYIPENMRRGQNTE